LTNVSANLKNTNEKPSRVPGKSYGILYITKKVGILHWCGSGNKKHDKGSNVSSKLWRVE